MKFIAFQALLHNLFKNSLADSSLIFPLYKVLLLLVPA